MEHVILTSSVMVRAAETLNVPCIATEQNPERLGTLCIEITKHLAPDNTKNFSVFPKMLFSMTTPEVWEQLKNFEQRKKVVLFGIEAHVCVFQTALDLIEKVCRYLEGCFLCLFLMMHWLGV